MTRRFRHLTSLGLAWLSKIDKLRRRIAKGGHHAQMRLQVSGKLGVHIEELCVGGFARSHGNIDFIVALDFPTDIIHVLQYISLRQIKPPPSC